MTVPNWWLFYEPGHWYEPNCGAGYLEAGIVDWTCNKDAKPGDLGIVYSRDPICSLVALVRVDSDPEKRPGPPVYYKTGERWADIEFLTQLEPIVPLFELNRNSELKNAWPLLRANMQTSSGPQALHFSVVDILREMIPQLEEIESF